MITDIKYSKTKYLDLITYLSTQVLAETSSSPNQEAPDKHAESGEKSTKSKERNQSHWNSNKGINNCQDPSNCSRNNDITIT